MPTALLITRTASVVRVALPHFLLVLAAITTSSAQRASDPALTEPPVQISPGVRYTEQKRSFQAVPSIEHTPDGRLWASWFARGSDGRKGDYVVLATSTDGGQTWSPPKLVIDPAGSVRAFDPCLWFDPDGVLWLFWAQSYGPWDGRGGVWCITSEDSQARSPTWAMPRRLCDGVMVNKPVLLASRDWLLPVSIWSRPASAQTPARYRHDPGPSVGAGAHVIRHTTGEIEKLGRVLTSRRDYDEHSIVELGDGSLWMLIRTPEGVMESNSRDSGVTWSPARPSAIRNINSRFCIRRLKSGSLLLVTHEPPDGRTRSHLIARISTDDGGTWRGGLMLDERPGVSYPDAAEGPKGVINIIYDYERTGARQILLAQFNEGNVLRGKASRSTRLRMVVSDASGGPPTRTRTSGSK
ncbi:MAG: glycoside hydrolase [Verrucomicrobiaceae bacterium]|nr:glycoside hydrolase [Verrucomicrobiaceae bacterium]